MTDTELLQERVATGREARRRKQKERYELAKEMGYSTDEAVVLQNWSLKRILALPKSR